MVIHFNNMFLQIDVDIGSSTVANGVLGIVCGAIKTLVVDMAFLVQVLANLVLHSCLIQLLEPVWYDHHPFFFF